MRCALLEGSAGCIAAAIVVLGLTALSTPAEARKMGFSFGSSKSWAPSQARRTSYRPAVYVGGGSRSAVPRKGPGNDREGSDLARLAGPEREIMPSPAVARERDAAVDKDARRKAWLDFCRPRLSAPDRYGIEYWIYAHDGCQFGRTE